MALFSTIVRLLPASPLMTPWTVTLAWNAAASAPPPVPSVMPRLGSSVSGTGSNSLSRVPLFCSVMLAGSKTAGTAPNEPSPRASRVVPSTSVPPV